MQVIGIFPNRDERTVVRSQLVKFGSVLAVANLREAKTEIDKIKLVDFIIIDDSAGDRTLRRRWSDELEKDVSTFEFLEALADLPVTPLILVCCGEKTSTDDLLYYNELGVDLILRRPYGSKELFDKFDEAYAILSNPPEHLNTWWTLRAMLRKGETDAALLMLEPLARSQPDDVRLNNLYASVLIKSGGAESLAHAQVTLEALERKLPQSISVKRKLFDLYKAHKNSEKFSTRV